MNTLIVPCAGRSTRFPNMRPKWMLTHPDGSLMLEKNLRAFDFKKIDRTIITIAREHEEKYRASTYLKQALNSISFEICILDEPTSGPAETVYRTIENMNVKGSIIVRDSDSLAIFDQCFIGENFIVGLDVNSYPAIDNLVNKSFLIKNEQDQIIDIVEKQIVSNNICLGVYGFHSADEFKNSFEKLQNILGNNSEMYISHIYSYLILNHKIPVNYIEVEFYEDWGTIEAWRRIQQKYAAYFFDFDGVIVNNVGKYGEQNWDNTFEPIIENLKKLKELSDSGAQILITTSRPEKYRQQIEEFFKEKNIIIYSFIMGMNHSPRILINDFAPTNPYPSCSAISIPRNSSFGDYLI